MSEAIHIHKATVSDISRILQIAETNDIDRISPGQMRQKGFLVSQFTEENYISFASRADYFYTLKVNSRIEAFLLAYASSQIQENDQVNLHIRDTYEQDFVISKQVCVCPSSMSKGYATKLYEYLFQIAKRPIYTSIVLEPRNERSERFHRHLAFEEVFQYTPSDGMKRQIWRKDSHLY